MNELQQGKLEIEIAPKFKIGDEVYFIYKSGSVVAPAKGRIVNVWRMDSLNTKYIIMGKSFTTDRYDTQVYASLGELKDDFFSVLIQ